MKQKSLRVGLLGTFGYGNLGDAAIQDALIQSIRLRLPDADIVGFSLNPEDTESRHGIKSFPISRMSWLQEAPGKPSLIQKISTYLRTKPQPVYHRLERWLNRIPIEFGLIRSTYRNLKGLDLLIVSGGGQLDDYWAGGGPWSHPYTLLKFGLLARLTRVKYIFLSVGAGPLDAWLSQQFVKRALGLAVYRSFRDEASRQLLADIGFDRQDPVYPDLAHDLKGIQQTPVHVRNGAGKIVGIGPIGYFKPECWPQAAPEVYERYCQKLVCFIEGLIQEGYQISFLPGEAYYDQLVIKDLKNLLAEMSHTESSGSLINAPIETVDDLIGQLRAVDYVITSRFHTVLLSLQLGVPVIALSYQSKIDSLMRDSGQALFCMPISDFEVARLGALFGDLVKQQDAIKAELRVKSLEFRKSLAEQYERLFSSL
jgi:polysaccharide pyruvyl transferase WcaK-like protein